VKVVFRPIERVDDTVILKPHGRLSLREGHELLGVIFAEVERMPRDVIVDLSGVSDMSSWGFALMCGLARKLAQMGHSLRIAGPTPFVRKYLEIFTGFKTPLEFHDTREDALREARLRRARGEGKRPTARPEDGEQAR
jgi:anti-anti-sigma factor